MKEEVKYFGFEKFVVIVCLISAMFLSIIALFLPPQGEIDGSVLFLVGEVLLFVGSIMGIKLTTFKSLQKILEHKANK